MNETDSEGGGCTGVNKTDTVTEPKELSFQKRENTLGNYTNRQPNSRLPRINQKGEPPFRWADLESGNRWGVAFKLGPMR